MIIRINVFKKPNVLDIEGKAIMGALERHGFSGIKDVKRGTVIDIELPDGTPDVDGIVKEMCEKMLVNDVIEQYSYQVL